MRDATPFIAPDASADALSAQVAALPNDSALLGFITLEEKPNKPAAKRKA
jgi:hypothetical protein